MVAENIADSGMQNNKRLRGYQSNVHVVQKGDTLSHIARRYGTTISKIKTWNASNENLSIGQKLLISQNEW
jgi:membrane-bound lytic murein transglycosylase D